MIPDRVWNWSAALAGARFMAFLLIAAGSNFGAQWQLGYVPLWIADFPISVIYFLANLPIPLAEAVVGPLWWGSLPLLYWKCSRHK